MTTISGSGGMTDSGHAGKGWSRPLAWTAAAYVVAAGMAYLPVLLQGQFLCDDFILLARIRGGQGIWNYHGADFYRPTISFVLTALWRLFGTAAFPYHLFNVLLLVGAGLLLRTIWMQLLSAQNCGLDPNRTGLVVGLAFILWTTHSESVSWIAGMTDTVAVLFAAAALLAFIRYRLRPAPAAFVGSVLLLWIALLAKEAAVAWIPAFWIFGFFLLPARDSWKRRIAEAACFAMVGIVYIFWRTRVLGYFGTGYGATGPSAFAWAGITSKIAKHFANSFLPMNRFIALWVDLGVAARMTAIAAIGTAALLLRKLPKAKTTSAWVRVVSGLIIMASILELPNIAISEFANEEFTSRIQLAEGLAMVCVAGVFFYWRRVLRFESLWAFLGGSLWAYTMYAYSVDRVFQICLLVIYLWFVYANRPVREFDPEEGAYHKIGVGFLLASLFALLPTLGLKVEFSGEASRFSYGPSFFSCAAIASVGLIYIKRTNLRLAAGLPLLTGSAILLYDGNIAWAAASDISLQTVEAVKSVLPARRIYVLCAPATVNGVVTLRIGMEHLPEVMFGDTHVQLHVGTYLTSGVMGDRIRVLQDKDDTYVLQAHDNTESRRFQRSIVREAEPTMLEGWFNVRTVASLPGFPIQLVDFQPKTDHILLVDCNSAQVIR